MKTDPKRSYAKQDLDLFNILQHPVWVFDIEKKAMFWANTAALEIWNSETLEELLARNFSDDMSEATERRLQDHSARLTRGEVMKEQWTLHPSGRGATTLELTGSAIRIDGGRVAALFEAELPDSREIDQSLTRGVEMLRHSPLTMCQFDMNGNLIYQNPLSISVFGTPDEDKGIFLARFVDRKLGNAMLEKVQEDNDYAVEAELYTKGSPKWFSVSVRKCKDPVSSESFILYSANDISEARQARQDTTQANLKSEFMAVVAHEIRTPLHQIVGYMDLLKLTQLSDQQVEQVHVVQTSTASLMVIINDLLDYTKLENGKLQLENICFATRGVLNGCVAAVEREAEEKGLVLHSHLFDELPVQLMGDPNRMRQILLNLLQNAIKFTEQGSILMKVSLVNSDFNDKSRKRLRFEVTDTGIGIDPSRQTIVFEKYEQAHASVARNYGGTGLGLAICKSLSEDMGGSIKLESELGKGTTVVVEIPFELPPSEEERLEKRSTDKLQELPDKCSITALSVPVAESVGLRILVAEDNKVNQKMVRSLLQRIGHTITVADNGQIAVDELVDLVLMDVQMPVMDGIMATKQIRSLGRTKSSIPVVGLGSPP
jgi:PAS domain S-box-containing protein